MNQEIIEIIDTLSMLSTKYNQDASTGYVCKTIYNLKAFYILLNVFLKIKQTDRPYDELQSSCVCLIRQIKNKSVEKSNSKRHLCKGLLSQKCLWVTYKVFG